jgi:L-malate glycosyltransferase
MRILIVTPTAYPRLTGNAITTERWRRSLSAKGLSVRVLSAEESSPTDLAETVEAFRPDLIHVYHAFKAGTLFLKYLERSAGAPPLILSPGGTDINLDLQSNEKRTSILQIMRAARLIIGQSSSVVQPILEQIPEMEHKLITIPKACVWFGNEPFDLRAHAQCDPETVLFFLPAGIRPVKGNVECLHAMERVYALRPQMRLAAAGPAIERDYARLFRKEIGRLSSFAFWIESIPPKTCTRRMHPVTLR